MEKSITNFASTVLSVMGVKSEEHMAEALPVASEVLGSGVRDKVLVVSVDAVPFYLTEERADIFAKVKEHAPYEEVIRTVMPSITPVCYGAMFSGTTPDKNGLPEYKEPKIVNGVAQPSLSVTPYTQSLVRQGKKVAVVTCNNGCIKSMLWEREADLYIVDGDDDRAMADKAISLLEKNEYDFIFLYQLDYDYTQHKVTPRGEKAIEVLKEKASIFGEVCSVAKRVWKENKYMLVFNSDHGCHETALGGGAHGEECEDDMKLKWFFGWNE